MREILVLCPLGLEGGLLSQAIELSENVRILVPEEQEQEAARLGAARIAALRGDAVEDEDAFADFLAEKISAWGSELVLAPATIPMRNIMPLLAWKLNAGLTADCTALRMEGDSLIQIRPAFGNSLMAENRSLSAIQMATIRPGTYKEREKPFLHPQIEMLDYQEKKDRIRLLSFLPFETGKPLTQAEIIVSGGMGIGSKEGFAKLEALAKKLNAGLAASRMAVDAGFAPYRCQVGLTGVTVHPRIYLAFGISGAVQHLAGMSGSDQVIAVNVDAKAPIFDYADYGLVADWETVVDTILKKY